MFDLKSTFLRLLVVGQQREVELQPIFGYELCAVPPSLTEEYGCPRRVNKAIIVHKLGVKNHKPPRPDVIIVDAQQLFYHVVWPSGGSMGMLAESLKARLALCAATEKILGFDRYTEISAKDHERQRLAGVGSTTFNPDLNSPLPRCEAVMTNKYDKRGLSHRLSTFNRDDGVLLQDEIDITTISYQSVMLVVRWSD